VELPHRAGSNFWTNKRSTFMHLCLQLQCPGSACQVFYAIVLALVACIFLFLLLHWGKFTLSMFIR